MPLRGESVGSAYVRIYADGSEVPGDIKRMLEDAEPHIREGGKGHGEIYSEEFNESTAKSFKTHFGKGKNDMFTELNEGLTKSIQRLDLADKFFSSPAWKRFGERMSREFPLGDAAAVAIRRMEEEFRASGDLEVLSAKDIGRRVAAARREILIAYEREERERAREQAAALQKINEDNDKKYELGLAERARAWAEMLDEAYRENKQFDEKTRKLQQDRDRQFDLSMKQQAEAWRDMLNEAYAENKKFDARWSQMIADQDKRYELHIAHLQQLDQLRLKALEKDTESVFHKIDVASNKIGSLFGKGSRNNFLNFIGSLVAGMVRLTKIVPTLFGIFQAFGDGVVAGGKALGVALLGLTLGIGAVAAAFTALTLIAGPVVALLSGLLGIVTALVATITFAAIGAVAALAGAFTVLAGGIGIAAAAYASLTDKQKEALKADFQPVIDSVKRLGKAAAEGAFDDMAEQGKRLAAVLDSFEPLFERVGESIRNVANDWIGMLEGPGFTRFENKLTKFLPGAVESLGKSIGNLAGGLGGVFTAAIPSIERFLDWLEKITEEFNDWANSDEGQKEIKQFLKDAGDSAEALGGFLSEIVGFLGDIFDKGRGTGDSLFKDMEEGLENIRDFFEENPEALEEWFDNAKDTFESLGELLKDINGLLDELDSKQNRLASNKGLQLLGDAIQIISTFAGIAHTNLTFLFDIVEAIGWAAEETYKWLANMAGAIEDFFIIEDFKFPDIKWPNFAKGFGGAVKMIDPTILVPKMTQMASIAGRLPGMIGRAVDGIPGVFRRAIDGLPGIAQRIFNLLPPRAQRAVTSIVGSFTGVVGKIRDKFDGLGDSVRTKFTAAVDRIRDIPGQIVGLFSGLASRIISAIGNIVIKPTIDWPSLKPGGAAKGEQGTAADLGRYAPLSDTDAAVRAFRVLPGGGGDGVTTGTSRPAVDASGWTIVTPSEDPWVVATEVLNDLVAKIA